MIFLKINCPNFSRLVWRRDTKFQIGMAAAIPAIPLAVPLVERTRVYREKKHIRTIVRRAGSRMMIHHFGTAVLGSILITVTAIPRAIIGFFNDKYATALCIRSSADAAEPRP